MEGDIVSDDLRIDFNWLGRPTGNPVDRAFYANIGLAVGEEWLSRLEDREAQTVRSHLRGCAYHLANWFAANWWRLRWEPETPDWSKDADWRLAHSIASAGGGFVWPNVLFASDGDSLAVASLPRTKVAAFEPIRYLDRVQARISAADFERKVDAFMEGVLSRLDSLSIRDATLPGLWEEVMAERSDSATYARRKLEAMAGYDPDEAPVELLLQMIEDKANLGKSALEEVTAEARHATGPVLQTILELDKSKTGGFRGKMPSLRGMPRADGERPWQSAARLAQFTRQQWNFGNKPIKNKALADLVGIKPDAFTDNSTVGTQMAFALRTRKHDTFDLYFDRPNPTTRRFAVSRLIGDQLWFEKPERLFPATRAKTSRQKFQRAFAQEFLCPIDELLKMIPAQNPDEDDIFEAAKHFHVSPLMIRTTLVNHHELRREALAWKD